MAELLDYLLIRFSLSETKLRCHAEVFSHNFVLFKALL